MGFEDELVDKAFSIFGIGFGATIILSIIGSLFTFGIIIAVIVMLIKSFKKNNNSPRLTVMATIVAKRAVISQSHHGHTHRTNNVNDFNRYGNTYFHDCDTSTSTFYYVTFQVDSGDRMELCVPTYEYGLLIEGDRGRLSFQGTRYISFERC